METNSFVINCRSKSETDSAGVSGISTEGYRAHKTPGLVQERIKKKKKTYVDDAFSVPHQKVPEEPGLVQIPQSDHVIHALHRGGVHGLEGHLFTDLVLLRASYRRINTTSSKPNKSPDDNAPFLRHRSSRAFQNPSPLPLPQSAPRNQSPPIQNHPSWRQHQGTCTEMAR